MKSRSIYGYIYFGTGLRYLQDIKESWPVHGEGWILENLNSFFSHIDEFELPVTQRACRSLVKIRDILAAKPKDYVLTADEAAEINSAAAEVRLASFAEAEGNVAFNVTDKRVDVNKLLSAAHELLAPGVFSSLPEVAQYDFSQAGRCIAFELPTAAAFHLLRETEDALRAYYCSIVKQKRCELMWGPMLASLRARRKPRSPVLLDNVDNIRRSFRNPTQHPEKVYDIQEVQDLLGLCVDVVNRMAS